MPAYVSCQIAKSNQLTDFLSGLCDSVSPGPHEIRRRHRRYVYPESVDAVLIGRDYSDPLPMTARDISAGGIGLLSRQPIRPGTMMMVALNRHDEDEQMWVRATAMHSTQTVGFYKVGVRFDTDEE